MLSHDLERMMSSGMKVELLPSLKGVYRVRIISGKKTYRGESLFSLAQAVENAQQKMHPTKNGRGKSDKVSTPAVFGG